MAEIITRTLANGREAHYARYVDFDGVRRTKATRARTPEGALAWAAIAEERVRRGLPGSPLDEARAKAKADAVKEAERATTVARQRLTVRKLCERFWEEYQGDNLADVKRYRREARSTLKCHVLPELGERVAADLRRVDVLKLRDSMKAAKKTSSKISKALRQLSRVFNWAIEMELLESNPVRGVKKPKSDGATKFYTEQETAQLLAWAAKNAAPLHPLIAFAFYTGCRKGEIASLRWNDIDWQGERIVVQRSWKRNARKSGKPVVVSLHPHLSAILSAHQKRSQGSGDALVFTGERGGALPKHNSGIPGRNLWGLDKAIKGTKVRRFPNPWHAFRHTHATTLAANGAGLTAIRDALGQSTLHMAANYTHLAAEHIAAHVAKLPKLGPVKPSKVTSLHAPRSRRPMDTQRIRSEKRADRAAIAASES